MDGEASLGDGPLGAEIGLRRRSASVSDDYSVQKTNDDATESKYAAVKLNYWYDNFIDHFAHGVHKRDPEISCGYWARVATVTSFARQFIEMKNSKCQIISLGPGFDTLYWRLKETHFKAHRFVEIDFSSVTSKKIRNIRKPQNEPKLFTYFDAEPVESQHSDLHTGDYHLLGADLRQISELEQKLDKAEIDYTLPTLILSECVLIYMSVESSSALLQFLANKFETVGFLNYEQKMGNRPTVALSKKQEREGKENGVQNSQSQQQQQQSATPIATTTTPAVIQPQLPQQQQQQSKQQIQTTTAAIPVTTTTAISQTNVHQNQHQYRKVSASEGYERSASQASSSTTASSQENRDDKVKPIPQKKRRRSRQKRNITVASRETIVAPSKPSLNEQPTVCKTSAETIADKDKTVEKAVDAAPPLVKRNRFKKMSVTPKEEHTEFEKIKVKARPAISKKNLAAAASRNIQKMMNNSVERSPTLKSFEEVSDSDDELKSAKPGVHETASNPAPTEKENPNPGNLTKAKEKERAATATKEEAVVKNNENASDQLPQKPADSQNVTDDENKKS